MCFPVSCPLDIEIKIAIFCEIIKASGDNPVFRLNNVLIDS